jgi:Fe-Mn family superoxide dismutase
MYNFIKSLNESIPKKKLVQVTLPYPKDGLGRSQSKQTIEYHFGQLYKGYVDRFNAGEGDADFNEAGAFLHSIYFPQLRPPRGNNKPVGAILEYINQHFKSWDKFKEEFKDVAMKVQGSGWVYLSTDGKIKTIVNHEIKNDILVLVDWWEHAWALDYQSHKDKYLENIWKIMDWDRINIKMEGNGLVES